MPAIGAQPPRVDLCLLRLASLGQDVVITVRLIRDLTGRPVERTFTTSDVDELLELVREFAERFRDEQSLGR